MLPEHVMGDQHEIFRLRLNVYFPFLVAEYFANRMLRLRQAQPPIIKAYSHHNGRMFPQYNAKPTMLDAVFLAFFGTGTVLKNSIGG